MPSVLPQRAHDAERHAYDERERDANHADLGGDRELVEDHVLDILRSL
jgi:hypothetical protein